MDEASVPKYSNQYGLSIRFSSDGFSLLVADASDVLISGKNLPCLLFSMTEDEVRQMINQEPEMRVNYRKIELICDLDNYSLIPHLLFKTENAADFLNLQQPVKATERVLYNKLDAWGMVNVFSIPCTLQNALHHLFPGVEIEHQISYFLTHCISKNVGTTVNVWVRPKMIDVVVIKDGNVLLINSYAFTMPEDLAYFLLSIYEQLVLNKETVPLNLYNATNNPELSTLLKQYLSVVSDN